MQLQSRFLIGQYFPGNSFIHRSHPGHKIALVILFCVLVFQLKSLSQFLAVLALILILFRISKISLLLVFRGMKPILFLLGFTFLIHALSTEGEIIWKYSLLEFTREGLERGLFYSLRLILVVLASSLLTLTTSSVEITYALDKFFLPLKHLGFPAQEFSLMLAVSLRFVPVLLEELEKLILAQKMRGAKFGTGGISDRVNAYLSLLIPLFQNALDRADQLAMAMEVRGFDPETKRTSFHKHKFDSYDVILLLYLILGAYAVSQIS